MRDPNGFRPLCLGKLKGRGPNGTDGYCVASETYAPSLRASETDGAYDDTGAARTSVTVVLAPVLTQRTSVLLVAPGGLSCGTIQVAVLVPLGGAV